MLTPNEAVLRRIQAYKASADSDRHFGSKVTEQARNMAVAEREMLATAALYTWRPDLIAAMQTAAQALPEPVTLTPELLPSKAGLYLFSDLIRVDPEARSSAAVGWLQIEGMEFVALWLFAPPWLPNQPGPFLSSTSMIATFGVDVLSSTVGDLRKIEPRGDAVDIRALCGSMVRLLTASWLWFRQRVLVEQPTPVASYVRKQAEREKIDPAVRVVVLRRSEHQPSSMTESQQRDWSCQWLVRGHWRQQFYGSTNEHRPVWIDPYVKGRVELVEYWRARLPEGERKTLEVLLAADGTDVERERIDEATGYKRSSRDAYLTRLKARGLVDFTARGMVRASEELFA